MLQLGYGQVVNRIQARGPASVSKCGVSANGSKVISAVANPSFSTP